MARRTPQPRRASLNMRGFVVGIAFILILVLAGKARVHLVLEIQTMEFQMAHLQRHALRLEQDAMRLAYTLEHVSDPAKLRSIATQQLGLVEPRRTDPAPTVLLPPKEAVLVDNFDPFSSTDQSSPRLVSRAVDLLGAGTAMAATTGFFQSSDALSLQEDR